jgi:hypothetical protein
VPGFLKEMEDTGDDSVEQEDPHEWSPQQVATFLRALGTAECFQSAVDQVLQLGVDDSVFFELSLDQLQGVCEHARVYARMCEFKHSRRKMVKTTSQHLTTKSRRV